jgi:hypothetical protein
MQAAFPGAQVPAQVVVTAPDVTSPEVQAGMRDLRERAAAHPGSFGRPITVSVSRDSSTAVMSIPLAGRGTDAASVAALEKLRSDLVPAAFGGGSGVTASVTGDTASSQDFTNVLKDRMPLVFAFVLGAAFLLLLVTFRSIVIPLKAIALNLLSVGAAYGVTVWVFQEGHLEGLLGFQSNGAITSWLPLFLFVVLFGLSMDYHVFILTRVKEAHDRGMATDQAVAHGIKTTAGGSGDERGGRDGRGVRHLRHALVPRLQGDGSGARGGDPDRRDDRPRSAPAGHHEAARRLELVPAELARLAAASAPRARDGSRTGVGADRGQRMSRTSKRVLVGPSRVAKAVPRAPA